MDSLSFNPITGNRCGHDPKNPKFEAIEIAGDRRPHVLDKALHNIALIYYLQKSAKRFLPNLCRRVRKRRTERLDAIVCVSKILLAYTQADGLKIGFPDNKGGVRRSFSIIEIARKAGLPLRRTQRAISDLVSAGYMKVQQRFSVSANGFKGHLAVRAFTQLFFNHLDISHHTLNGWFNWWKKRNKRPGNRTAEKNDTAVIARNDDKKEYKTVPEYIFRLVGLSKTIKPPS